MLKFEVTEAEAISIQGIVHRWAGITGQRRNLLETEMDITACHVNDVKLDLEALRLASEAHFCHDVAGIRMYMDRETGKLTDCFSPRFAKR